MPDSSTDYTVIEACRSCTSPKLELILDLGDMPLTGALVAPGDNRTVEPRYPLTLVRCEECSLVQILETIDPRILYGREYPYYSSVSDTLVEHAKANAKKILRREQLDASSLVVELASNDGYMLQWFRNEGVPVLGIDPATGPAAAAESRGISTINEYFDVDLAEKLVAEGRRADVIIGNNVLAHVPDQNAFVEAMGVLLASGGTIVMEFPYVADLIDNCEFDTVYHEHHCYFAVATVQRLFHRHGLELVSVEHLDIHGGSLRVSFKRDGSPDETVATFLDLETRRGVLEKPYYEDFAKRVGGVRRGLVELLERLKSDGHSIAAYGAAAKGVILLNYCGIDERLIDYVVDLNSHKQGWEMPGIALPIHGPGRLADDRPDYLLVLAWNFKDEIIAQQAAFARAGGRFILPIPKPGVV